MKVHLRELIFYLLLLIFLFNFGCATPPKKYTQEEWTKITTREFKNKTINEVLDAAERVLILSDESDVKIYKFPNRLIAQRKASAFFLISYARFLYSFDLQLEQKEDKVKSVLLITISSEGMYATTMGLLPVPSNFGVINEHPEDYELFYSRIESILYGKKWISCDEAKEVFLNRRLGSLESICFQADDKSPF